MKTVRLSFKLMGILLVALGISACGGDDENTPKCITCTFKDDGPPLIEVTQDLCKDDPTLDWQSDYDTWKEAVEDLRLFASQDPDVTCD